MIESSLWGRIVVGVAIVTVIAACSSNDSKSLPDSAELGAATEARVANPAELESAGPVKLTTADLDGFEKGLAREIELVRAASERSSTAKTAQERGEAIQAAFEINTIPAAAPLTGLSVDRYRLVRETLSKLLTTLDFQGKIDGPQSVDTTRADAAMKARLATDPYAALDPSSASEFKSRLNRIVPLWVQYVNLTAVGG